MNIHATELEAAVSEASVITNVVLGRSDWEWLKRAAMARALQHGGRASASGVLRDLVREAAASQDAQRATA